MKPPMLCFSFINVNKLLGSIIEGQFLKTQTQGRQLWWKLKKSIVKGSVKFLTTATCTHRPLEPSPQWSCSSFEYLNRVSASPSHLPAPSATLRKVINPSLVNKSNQRSIKEIQAYILIIFLWVGSFAWDNMDVNMGHRLSSFRPILNYKEVNISITKQIRDL